MCACFTEYAVIEHLITIYSVHIHAVRHIYQSVIGLRDFSMPTVLHSECDQELTTRSMQNTETLDKEGLVRLGFFSKPTASLCAIEHDASLLGGDLVVLLIQYS